MDNFSVRTERNFHNLTAKPRRMHLLDKPSGYASAMAKSTHRQIASRYLGRVFPTATPTESTSQPGRSKRDALSGWRA